MDDGNRQSGAVRQDTALPDAPDHPHDAEEATTPSDEGSAATSPNDEVFDDSLIGELGALIDDGRTYAEAEIAFQKTRAKLAGRLLGVAAASVVVAIILLHIAFLALAVGLVIALAPLVTIWGAIAIVVGALLLAVFLLVRIAARHGGKLSALFSSADTGDGG